ncbi:hypothetical protein [Mycobacterium colombiense]
MLAERMERVERRNRCLREHLLHLLGRLQDLGVVAQSDELWELCEGLRFEIELVPADVEKVDELIAQLFTRFGPKVKNSTGRRDVQWREGPWYQLAPMDDDG